MQKVNLFYQCHFIVASDISRNNIYLKNKIKLYLKTENLTTGWYNGWYKHLKWQQLHVIENAQHFRTWNHKHTICNVQLFPTQDVWIYTALHVHYPCIKWNIEGFCVGSNQNRHMLDDKTRKNHFRGSLSDSVYIIIGNIKNK